MNTGKRLSLGKKLGYSAGIFSDTLGYSMFYSYFFTFLTSIVGVGAAAAGIISSIGILWDGITDPIIGYIADGKPHRRRKMIMWTSIPYALAVVLTYVAVDFGSVGNVIYYTLCALAFWLFYTTVCVPYYSAVPELTPDYDERTGLRSFTAWINSFANLITLACPMLLVQFFGTYTKTPAGGWTATAALFGVIIIIAAFICSHTLKKAEDEQRAAGIETQQVEREKLPLGQTIVNLLKEFIEILTLKPVLILFSSIVIVNIFRAFTSTGFTTYMIYCLGWGADKISLGYAVLIASWLLYFPLVDIACKKWDRKACLVGGALITLVGRTILGFMPFVNTTFGCYLNIFLSNFQQCTYLALCFAMPYDLAELYEYKHNGLRADSTIQSVPFMAQKIGAALGALVWGLASDAAGFDAAIGAQSAETVKSITMSFCVWINVFLLVFVVILHFYKVNREKTAALQEANLARREGREFSTEAFADLL